MPGNRDFYQALSRPSCEVIRPGLKGAQLYFNNPEL